MKRRNFFKTATLSGSVLAVGGLTACTTNSEKKEQNPDLTSFKLQEATINELQQKMQSGELTAGQICRDYLERIKQVDPLLHAVIELNPDAQDIARKLDEERKNGQVRGPLHGIPIMIKDNIDTGDKMQTTAGSLSLAAVAGRWSRGRSTTESNRLRTRTWVSSVSTMMAMRARSWGRLGGNGQEP